MTYTIAVCTVKTLDDGQRNCPKHVEFHSKNKFEKLVHLVGFFYKKFNTMHGHMNVKFSGGNAGGKRQFGRNKSRCIGKLQRTFKE
jgi:hypothetical protein